MVVLTRELALTYQLIRNDEIESAASILSITIKEEMASLLVTGDCSSYSFTKGILNRSTTNDTNI